MEFRPPDPAANPYLAFAAMLMAGLDGVLNKINPGEPLDKDIYDLSPEEMKSVPSMPGSLDEALACLEDDHGFLMRGDVFTEELIETFIDYKRKNEAEAVRLRPHPYEFALVLRHLVVYGGQSRVGSRPIVQVNISPGGLPKRAISEGLISPLGLEGDAARPSRHPRRSAVRPY